MKTSDYDYHLPTSLIACQPCDHRDDSRMLHISPTSPSTYRDLYFTDIIDILKPGDCLVRNNTKVVNARIPARKTTSGACEIFLVSWQDSHAKAMLKSNKSISVGAQLFIADEYQCSVEDRTSDGLFTIKLAFGKHWLCVMRDHGQLPLPPYMKRSATCQDDDRYQTIYAQHPGSLAAPTAGLHFSESIFHALTKKSITVCDVTLHVGLGTFLPVKTDHIDDHMMHHESFSISDETMDIIDQTRASQGRVIAVGTTSLRAVESYRKEMGSGFNSTNLFIKPGYQFERIDGLITNFHLPKSTLLMLVSAMIGRQACLAAYAHAVAQCYRFYSYGDAMLLL